MFRGMLAKIQKFFSRRQPETVKVVQKQQEHAKAIAKPKLMVKPTFALTQKDRAFQLRYNHKDPGSKRDRLRRRAIAGFSTVGEE